MEDVVGKRLFEAETISHTLADVLHSPIEFDTLPAAVPRSICGRLGRCLDQNVQHRLRILARRELRWRLSPTPPIWTSLRIFQLHQSLNAAELHMKDEIAKRYREFEIPGTAQVVEGNGGLPKVRITTPDVIGEIYLHGAHITSWKPYGKEEALFLSSQSRWEVGRAIRGGVPICFPWFGGKADDPKAPAHGFVRTKSWHLEAISEVGNVVTVSMFTENDETTQRWWPAEFRLVYRATFGRELSVELVVSNTGRTSLRFEEALHTYHRVGNINEAR